MNRPVSADELAAALKPFADAYDDGLIPVTDHAAYETAFTAYEGAFQGLSDAVPANGPKREYLGYPLTPADAAATIAVQGLAANRIDSSAPVVRARPSGGGRCDLEGLAPMDDYQTDECGCNFCLTGERDGLGHDDGPDDDDYERAPTRDLSDIRAEGLLP